jgi:hypothetical protein
MDMRFGLERSGKSLDVRIFENRVLRRIFGFNWVGGRDWRTEKTA